MAIIQQVRDTLKTQVVDESTGELITQVIEERAKTKIVKKASSADFNNFVALYLKDLSLIYNIKPSGACRLFLVICEELYGTMPKGDVLLEFTALQDDKIRWSKKLEDVSPDRVVRFLQALVKSGIVMKTSRAKYAINPDHVHYGALSGREKVLEIAIQYRLES